MSAFLSQTRLGLLLALRNRIGLIYGFIFPLVFLAAFKAIYRNEETPLALHLGELLTVTVLGGACFGLPTTLVSERERGVWRRYRLTPASTWLFIASTLTTRMVLIAAAALLQIGVALAVGMPKPVDPLGLMLAFMVASTAFLAMGMVIAQLAPNVPAVQALGQCIFLPMLMIGGVAVRLSTLPDWALHASVFFPGRYAVTAMQRSVTGLGQAGGGFELLCLLMIAVASSLAAVALFRWDSAQRVRLRHAGGGLLLALGVWIVVGVAAEVRGKVATAKADVTDVGSTDDFVAVRSQPASWHEVTPEDFKRIAFEALPPDEGLISPIAMADEVPDPLVATRLERIRAALASWPPGQVDDVVQRVRNVLYVAALPDLLQMGDVERYLPQIVFDHLKGHVPYGNLRQILYWIALHPDEGDDSALAALHALGLPDGAGPSRAVRPRVMIYAFKLLGRMTGDIQQQ
jgi:ABC-2 type transport system permease protein